MKNTAMITMSIELSLFTIAAFCASVIFCLGIADLLRKDFIFWPPPQKGSWQDNTFIWLFRGMIYPLLLLSFFEFRQINPPVFQFGLGGILLVAGFGTAFASTFNLGWKNALGDKKGLVTNDWFSYSRNPVYMVTWFGLLGWGLVIPSTLVWIILFIWGLIYTVAIFLEEAWLEKTYGAEYRTYKKTVRRFL